MPLRQPSSSTPSITVPKSRLALAPPVRPEKDAIHACSDVRIDRGNQACVTFPRAG